MASFSFILDTPAATGHCPIHLRVICNSKSKKVSTGLKVLKDHWDTDKKRVLPLVANHLYMNNLLDLLEEEATKLINQASTTSINLEKIQKELTGIVDMKRKENDIPAQNANALYLANKEAVTFLDLFAGAGGFSEGFLQAEFKNRAFDFLLASDINENCDLTHRVRYNYQLQMDAEFLRQDITEPDFLSNLLEKIKGRRVDVVCGGPPCQSFSLAGKRKKFDKKDDLFAHYLNVIRHLRPKYFVMENVKGILTKEQGKIKDMIIKEIRSILDFDNYPNLVAFVKQLKREDKANQFVLDCLLKRLEWEPCTQDEQQPLRDAYIETISNAFKKLTPKIVSYKESKTDLNINTIRRGFSLLKRQQHLEKLRKAVILEKNFSDLHDDHFANSFDEFLEAIQASSIIEQITKAFESLNPPKAFKSDIEEIKKSLIIYTYTFDECIDEIRPIAIKLGQEEELDDILKQTRLYNIHSPFVALASNYGVPQNRERVLFIGCRKDQPLIKDIPPTVDANQKVTVFEALHDLDFIDIDEEKSKYEPVDVKKLYNGTAAYMQSLLQKRDIDGKPNGKKKSFAEWSREGRLNGRFADAKPPIYVRNFEEFNQRLGRPAVLHNHKTSDQKDEVVKRLKIILKHGDYDKARPELEKLGLSSEKRDYNLLKPDGQSPTVLTMPDDYVHYRAPRALTVREMARLQSFDDTFVFQGKRSTGGEKRKVEVPQFTLVGNAVPPLMARAVAMEILKNIE